MQPTARSQPSAAEAPLWTVIGVTLLSRLLCWPGAIVGKDGPAYINAMKLDRTFDVPMPGNVGWVLLGKLFHAFGLSPVNAFAAATVSVSVAGTLFFYLLAARFWRPWMAACCALAMALSPVVWYHADTFNTYETWLCVCSAIAYFGVRLLEGGGHRWAYRAAVATGLGTILRPDMVTFGGPLLIGFLALSRAPLRVWAACVGICAACCCVWFFTTAAALGGPAEYLSRVHKQVEYIETYGTGAKGFFEGLGRNSAKLALVLAWAGPFVAPFAVLGLLRVLRRARTHWRWIVLGGLALAPSLYFAIFMFMGSPGLVLPTMGVGFLLAAYWLDDVLRARGPNAPLWAMGIVGALGAVQFLATPILEERTQRDVILNVMFTKLSAHAIRRPYNANLADYGIDASLANTLRQMRHPEAIPHIPTEDVIPQP